MTNLFPMDDSPEELKRKALARSIVERQSWLENFTDDELSVELTRRAVVIRQKEEEEKRKREEEIIKALAVLKEV